MTIQNLASPTIANYCDSSWVILIFNLKLFTYSEWQMEDIPGILPSETEKKKSSHAILISESLLEMKC